jgi:hypothetical protein
LLEWTKEASETSEASATSATPAPATATPFPQSAKYIADTKSADGKPMVIGIAVDGTEIAAYACNGTDDEAWFFGNQKDGKIDITSRFKDTLKAEFDGKDVVGDLTMNGVAFKFSAPAVPAPAGMYTADLNGVRASGWSVPTAARPACSSTAASAAVTSNRPSCSS